MEKAPASSRQVTVKPPRQQTRARPHPPIRTRSHPRPGTRRPSTTPSTLPVLSPLCRGTRTLSLGKLCTSLRALALWLALFGGAAGTIGSSQHQNFTPNSHPLIPVGQYRAAWCIPTCRPHASAQDTAQNTPRSRRVHYTTRRCTDQSAVPRDRRSNTPSCCTYCTFWWHHSI